MKPYCYYCDENITDLNTMIVNREMESIFCCEDCAEGEIENRIETYQNDNVTYVGNTQLKETLEQWGFTIK